MENHIEKIIAYMEENIEADLKSEGIAKKFGYSKFHFSREFKRVSGLSPTEFIMGLRVKKGIGALVQGETVINSQLESGYNSSGTFSTTFKKNTGLSPRDYSKHINELLDTVKKQETVDEDQDSLFYRNPNYPALVAPYKLVVKIEVPNQFKGLAFCGLFLKPNPNHQPAMGRCRVRDFTYEFYHLPKGVYYPLACGIPKNLNPFHYFQLEKALRACDGQSIEFPLSKNEEITIKLRDRSISDPPVVINLPNILANGIKQQMKRNKERLKRKWSDHSAR